MARYWTELDSVVVWTEQVPRQDCKLVPTETNCKDIPEKQCRQRAYQQPRTSTREICH